MATDICGKWAILGNGYQGELLLQKGINNTYAGQIQYRAARIGKTTAKLPVENLTEITVDNDNGIYYIRFLRTAYGQKYFAISDKTCTNLYGHYEDKTGHFNFNAIKR